MRTSIAGIAALGALLLAACASSVGGRAADPIAIAAPSGRPAPPFAGYPKVVVIVEENKEFTDVVGNKNAPVLTHLATTYGQASAMDAGYPRRCPSLAAYLLVTSGDDHGVCDDDDPAAHPIPGPNLFSEVTGTGKKWRLYAEDMPTSCAQRNAGLFAVRHAPSNYYTDLREECRQRSIPLGGLADGAFHDDIVAGSLPELSFVIPNLCNDMHGAARCGMPIAGGDHWIGRLVPLLQSGPDYRAGRLAILIMWDEGNSRTNHIPFVAISPTTASVNLTEPTTLCSVLATVSELMGVDPLGCARQVPSMATSLRLLPASPRPS